MWQVLYRYKGERQVYACQPKFWREEAYEQAAKNTAKYGQLADYWVISAATAATLPPRQQRSDCR